MNPQILFAVVVCALLAGCEEESALPVPVPVAMTEQAVGYYCQMGLLEHSGPKAQIHVAHLDQPLWFSQVRDAVAFTRLPEETAEVTKIYVSDMGKAASWANPGINNWIDAHQAYFVIDSRRIGGMGAPEAVPFGNRDAANAFAETHGGRVVRLAEIPDAYVLAPIEVSFVTPFSEDLSL